MSTLLTHVVEQDIQRTGSIKAQQEATQRAGQPLNGGSGGEPLLNVLCIPCCLGASLLPKKPMYRKGGKTLLRYTYEAACRARTFDRILIVTGSEDVQQNIAGWGVQCVMTKKQGNAEAVADAVYRTANCADTVVMLDLCEPEMTGPYLDQLVRAVETTGNISTLAAPFATPVDVLDQNKVKIIVSKTGSALYCTRANVAGAMQQLGCYGFTRTHLERIIQMPPSALAATEQLEQVAWLDNGMELSAIRVESATSAINTEEDWEQWKPPRDAPSVSI